jgi:DNA-directed RNA polymerase subunit beta
MPLIYKADATNNNMVEAIQSKLKDIFPVEGKQHTLELSDVHIDKEWDPGDTEAQMGAKLHGRTWGLPILGKLTLRDKATGKALSEKPNARILTMPALTRHYSFIVDGKENTVTKQWRLKSGVYTRIKANGELESQWNLAKGRGFHVGFDPASRKFTMSYGSSTVGLYTLLKTLGASDSEMERAWGPNIFKANYQENPKRDLHKLYKVITGALPNTSDEEKLVAGRIRDEFAATELRTDTTQLTLGKPYNKVNPEALLGCAHNLLMVSRGEKEPDQRDSIVFKELLDVDDFIKDRLTALQRKIQGKIRNRLDFEDDIDHVYSPDYLNQPVHSFFQMSISELPRQVNPVDMFGSIAKTTVMGEGGISSAHGVPVEARLLDNSHLGMLDAIDTPEGSKVGINLFLPLGAGKIGREPTTAVRDVKTGKIEEKTAVELYDKVVAFPDQFTMEDGKPKPTSKTVAAVGKGNELVRVKPSEVDYALPSAKTMFSVASNLVPFLQNNTGPRVSYASHHLSQALSLANRERPLVAVSTGAGAGAPPTFEDMVGYYFSSRSPVDGKVTKIEKSRITIRGSDGKLHYSSLYDHYPLNEKSSYLNSDPVVKVGDEVTRGQLVADSNFTLGGQLALGKNMKVAYMSYFERTYDDAVAISESAANAMASKHMYKPEVLLDDETIVDKRKFRALYRDNMTDAQAAKLNDDGVIKEGEIVESGDTLVAVLRKRNPMEEETLLKGISKSLVKPFSDHSVVWDSQYPGKVVRVVKNAANIIVHVETTEPMGVGDKLSGRHGNKGVVGSVIKDDQMPRTKDGPVDVILNPISTAARIITGPSIELALAKVAEKNGKQLAVSNFEPRPSHRIVEVPAHWTTVQTKEGPKKVWIEEYSYERDYVAQVAERLEKEGLEEKEEVFDPVSGKSLGKVVVGREYLIKQVHQSEKKLSARSGGPGYDYDANMAPRGSGSAGGQSMGELGLYSLLAHGALGMIRENMTIKSDASQDEVWTTIQRGEPLPPPKPSFAYGKFLALLRAMGVNVDKSNSQLTLRPLTDDDTLKFSNGELKDPALALRAKDLKPEEGGLFDARITGGIHGDRWCFSYSTSIDTVEGPLPIGYLVKNCIHTDVLSFDFELNQFVYEPIEGWYMNDVDDIGVAEVDTSLGTVRLYCNGGHEIYTEGGFKVHVRDAIAALVLEETE